MYFAKWGASACVCVCGRGGVGVGVFCRETHRVWRSLRLFTARGGPSLLRISLHHLLLFNIIYLRWWKKSICGKKEGGKKKKKEGKSQRIPRAHTHTQTHASPHMLRNDTTVSGRRRRTKKERKKYAQKQMQPNNQTNAANRNLSNSWTPVETSEPAHASFVLPLKTRRQLRDPSRGHLSVRQSAFHACSSQMIIYRLLSTTDVWINS